MLGNLQSIIDHTHIYDFQDSLSSKWNEMKDKEKVETRGTRESDASPNQHKSSIGRSVNQLNSCYFLNIYAEKVLAQGNQIKIPIDRKIFYDEYIENDHIGCEELHQIIRHGQLGASVISVYMR